MKQLYRQPNPDPGALVSRITSALDASTRREMAGSGVACCLGALLAASRDTARDGLAALLPGSGELPPLLAASEVIRERAERTIARLGLASRFSDLALNALTAATFEAGSGGASELFSLDLPRAESALGAYAREGRLHDLARVFVAHDLDHVFRYFVARDSSEFIGGPGLPTAAEASQLRDAVARHCRDSMTRLQTAAHERALATALCAEDEATPTVVLPVLSSLIDEGLQLLAAGG